MAFSAGSIITTIGGDLAPLRSALAKAKEMAGEFSNSIGEKLGFAELAGGIGAAVSVAAAIERVKHSMEAIDEAGKAADRLGLTTQAFVGLEHQARLAGVANEELGMSLMHMQKNLADAANGTGSAQASLAGLGLSAKDLANMAPDQAMGKIADAMKNLTNVNDRASVAMDLFGARGGTRLAAMLNEGSEGIRKAREEAEKLGISFSRVDAAKVEEANDAMTKMTEVLTGVANQVAVGIAPYVSGLADMFVQAATAGGGMGPKVGAGVEWAAKGIAKLADWLEVLEAGYYKLTAAGGYWIDFALQGIDKLAHAMDWLDKKMGGKGWDLSFLDSFTDAIDKQIDELNTKAGQHWDNFMAGTNSKAVSRAFDEFRNASQKAAEDVAANAEKMKGSFKGVGAAATDSMKKAEEMLAGMRSDVAGFGQDEGQKKLIEFKALKGVSPQQVDEYTKLAGDLSGKIKDKELKDKAKSILEGIQTPLEKATEQADDLNEAFKRGQITSEQLAKGLKGIHDDAAKGVGGDKKDSEDKFSTLVRAGSGEAIKLAFQSQKDDPKTQIAKDQLAKLDQQLALLQQMRDDQVVLAYAEAG